MASLMRWLHHKVFKGLLSHVPQVNTYR